MSKKKPEEKVDAWMPLWIGAYLADTMRLTRDQHGGYLLLLIAYWRNKGPLLDDDEDLMQIAKASPEEWPRLRSKLEPFFIVESGCWKHDRAERELAAASARRKASAEKAKKAAAGRWSKKDAPSNASGNASGTPQAMHKECPTPSPSPSIAPAVAPAPAPPEGDDGAAPAKKERKSKKDPGRFDVDFEEVYRVYPKRPGANRAAGLAKYTARREEGEDHEKLLQGTKRYAKHCQLNATEPKYVKTIEAFFGPMKHYLSDWSPIDAPAGAKTATRAEKRASFWQDQPTQGAHDEHHEDAAGSVIDVAARRVD